MIDYGEGVSKRDISQLFKPFFSTEINGTGLGLYLSHSFCEANHAKLTYVEQNKGMLQNRMPNNILIFIRFLGKWQNSNHSFCL